MKALLRYLLLLLVSAVALQLVFALRIAAMRVVDPQSTSLQRSEIVRLLREPAPLRWQQAWMPYERIADSMKRAVIASEDAGFTEHAGIDWEAIEKAWEKNQRAQARTEAAPRLAAAPQRLPKLVGASTITQQLAKNLFLSSERSLPRKAQEFVLSMMLEALLSKERILEVYLNNVEWGAGVFGVRAAAQRYFGIDADRLAPMQAARLAVMLPAPKRFEKRPGSAYVSGRAATVVARMGSVELP